MQHQIQMIQTGNTTLGIEFGSTRIKAVLIDKYHTPIASGSYEWENQLKDGIWTYSLEDIWKGLQNCYQDLVIKVKQQYSVELVKIGAIGISAMMHGYMAFDDNGELLVPFRTWRNTTTSSAARQLTELFQFNIPERWSIAHLYQAILDQEAHVSHISYFTTLAGYIHWKLTGKKVLGIGDASGMFPIDCENKQFDQTMIKQFDACISEKGYSWKLSEILPNLLVAGEQAGVLTQEGANLLDISQKLQPGIPCCPPEGDAGTGMTATNSVAVKTGNVSAGTSVFAMIVLEKALSKLHREIDMVTTPDGYPVAMVHANNCTSDLNAWVGIFREFAILAGIKLDDNQLFEMLYQEALKGDADCGGLLSYGYYSGEFMTSLSEGRPLFVRKPESKFTLANFIRVHLFTALGALKIGMDILKKEEHVQLDNLLGHGGFFKTKEVGQKMMAAAMNTPVTVMETAGEGGSWGIALLAAYMKYHSQDQTLQDYLTHQVFANNQGYQIEATLSDVKGFEQFMTQYQEGIPIEKAAVEFLK